MDDELSQLLREIGQAPSSLALFLAVYRFLETSSTWTCAHRLKDALQQQLVAAPLALWKAPVLASAQSPMDEELPAYFTEAIMRRAAGGDAGDFALKMVAGVKAIDSAFAGVHIFGPPAVGELASFLPLRTRLRKGSPLYSHDGYGIFPSPRQAVLRSRRGQFLQDHFDYLNVVPLSGGIPVTYDFSASPAGLSGQSLERVAILPVAVKADEVEWTLQGSDKYRVGLSPACIDTIGDRLVDALEWVLTKEPEVVLLPELVGHARLDALIKRYLSKRSSDGQYIPTLVLCGSVMHDEGGRIRNRARVISGDGRELWLQDKLHAYEFDVDAQELANWPFRESVPVCRMEDIDIDKRQLTVFDLGPHLRCAVLICEDFKQPNGLEALEPWDVTLFLVPVMNGPLGADDWAFSRAVQLADRPGSMSVVANSGVLVPVPLAGGGSPDTASRLAHAVGSPRKDVSWTTYPDEPGIHPTAIFGRLTPYNPPKP